MTFRSLAATAGASVLLLVGVASPALSQSGGSSDSGTTTQEQKKGKKKKGRHGKLSDAQLTTVAEALGVTLEKLKAALAEVKTATAATDERETKAEKDELLATALGVTVEELRAAFASLRPARGDRGDCPGEEAAADSTASTDPAAL